jgi:hypothetical protein
MGTPLSKKELLALAAYEDQAIQGLNPINTSASSYGF